ncbi:MAG: hypothetical protein HC904_02475 [Blastochloris sp.]|nr:hypothetical protein [Blastochloris sp.]
MQKIQILFPDPVMSKLRSVSSSEDRPVSEIVRRAVERYLQQIPAPRPKKRPFPVFQGGPILISAENLKQEIYADDSLQP